MENPRHSAILILGAGPWKEWREANPDTRPDLATANFCGVNLQNCDLRLADLRHADLSGADLRHADLTGALITEAVLSGTLLDDANLSGAFLTGTLLGGASLRNADLRNANLSGADLGGADLHGAVLRSGLYDDPDRKETAARMTTLTFVNLRGASLVNCDLRGADLSGSKLPGADLSGALLQKANLSDADLGGARLVGANLKGANLYESRLCGCDLTSADLGEADLSGAKLVGAKLAGGSLRGTVLRNADCTRADFSDAALNGASLGSALLDRSIVVGASCFEAEVNETTRQSNLRLCRPGEPALVVDSIETAQLIHLLITRKKARDSVVRSVSGRLAFVFGPVTKKGELLEALTAELRKKNYSSILADTERIVGRKYRESLHLIIELSAFVIADLSSPHPFPPEALSVIYNHKVPLLPLLPEGHDGRVTLDQFGNEVSWLPPVYIRDLPAMLEKFDKEIFLPAELKYRQLGEIMTSLEFLM